LLYAVFEGILLGAISNWYNQYALGSDYQGIVLQAVMATMVTFGVMLVLFLTGIVKVTKKFVSILLVAGVAYLVIGIASLVAAMFGVGGGWGFYGVDGIGLLICVFGVLIAAFFLMLDFEAIKQGIAMGAPERESWRMAFGLTVTLVWIYLEFLRLLAIFSRN
ncbi:MAG: Bax inhibitor-1/YccA family protein, partial [Actinomycetales bacterium]